MTKIRDMNAFKEARRLIYEAEKHLVKAVGRDSQTWNDVQNAMTSMDLDAYETEGRKWGRD